MANCPCRECPYRKLTCHDHCDEYTQYHDALVEAREALRQSSEAINFLIKGYTARRKKAKVDR